VRRYGASPLHLAAHAAALALAGVALLQIAGLGGADRIALWLLGSIVLHDLVLLPLYSALDRAAQASGDAVNHLRVPAALSGLLLLVHFPLICGRSSATLERASGVAPEGYLERWLLATGVMFAVSAALYLRKAAAKRPVGTTSATERASS
jgi:hypothetical protein